MSTVDATLCKVDDTVQVQIDEAASRGCCDTC